MPSRPGFVLTIGVLLVLESLLRLFFYYEAVYAKVSLLQPMPPAGTMNLINTLNVLLGLVGFVVVLGLVLMTRWGYWGTLALSVVTVLFDGWASATISFTAFAGLILPVIFIIQLVLRRSKYFGKDTLAPSARSGSTMPT